MCNNNIHNSRGLTTSDNEDRPLERVGRRSLAANSQQLAHRNRLSRLVHGRQDLRLEVVRPEEVDLHTTLVRGRNVPVGVVAHRRHLVRLDEGAAEDEVCQERPVLREARQDDAVRDVRVQRRQRVAVRGAERMADVHDLGELAVLEAGKGAVADLVGEGLEGGDLEHGLDLVDGLAVRGLRDAEAVPGQRREAVVVDDGADVAVLAALGREVPIATIETNTVGQDLDDGTRAGVGLAVGRGQLVGSTDVGILFEVLVEGSGRWASSRVLVRIDLHLSVLSRCSWPLVVRG